MIRTEASGITLNLNQDTLHVEIKAGVSEWKWAENFRPVIVTQEEVIDFSRWQEIVHETFESGVGKGIRSSYRKLDGAEDSYAFETSVWVEEMEEDCPGSSAKLFGRVHFEWIPICEKGLSVKEVRWPGCMEFDSPSQAWQTLVNEGQGLLIPNTWENEAGALSFNGRFLTAGGYMPWYGQVKDQAGYIAIAATPWNAGAWLEHPAGGPYTHIGTWWEPSLGKMDYRRCMEYIFAQNCDYNDLCKIYRSYVKDTGLFVSLAEKAARVPSVKDLVGCSIMHCGIKTNVNPESDFFDKEDPEKNNHVTLFSVREKQMESLKDMGVEKLFLHLDGWAQPGYDNQHPDYRNACAEAGGWEGMKSLVDTVHRCGFLFGIHDQYRDYYFDAKTYDEEYATRLPDGTIPAHKRWAGGPQTYLCGTQAPYYVKRNFQDLVRHGIKLDGTYLDVFTCNEGDECDNPRHRMTRRECYEYRKQCFDWLLARGILTSSEEVSDWSMQSLIFCHYAPYAFMLKAPGTPREGIPVPLFNLVYHDCVLEPWMMDKPDGSEDMMGYALLNAGMPYLIRDGAYENTDGSFTDSSGMGIEEMIARCKVVQELHEKLAFCEMTRHELLDDTGKKQRTVFSDGTCVSVDLGTGEYEISTAQ